MNESTGVRGRGPYVHVRGGVIPCHTRHALVVGFRVRREPAIRGVSSRGGRHARHVAPAGAGLLPADPGRSRTTPHYPTDVGPAQTGSGTGRGFGREAEVGEVGRTGREAAVRSASARRGR